MLAAADLDGKLDGNLLPREAEFQNQPTFNVLSYIFFGSVISNFLVNVIAGLAIGQGGNNLCHRSPPLRWWSFRITRSIFSQRRPRGKESAECFIPVVFGKSGTGGTFPLSGDYLPQGSVSRMPRPRGFQRAGLDFAPLGTREAYRGPTQTPFSRTKFPCIPIPLSNLRLRFLPFESLLYKK